MEAEEHEFSLDENMSKAFPLLASWLLRSSTAFIVIIIKRNEINFSFNI